LEALENEEQNLEGDGKRNRGQTSMIPPEVKFDAQGLIRAVAQDADTGAVLTSAFQDRTALSLTFETGYAHYFSRSKNRPWKKGDKTGQLQEVIQVLLDCDGDTILLVVRQRGNVACHVGTYSCFFRRLIPEDGKIRFARVGEVPFFPPVEFAIDAHTINAQLRQNINPEDAAITGEMKAVPPRSTPIDKATVSAGPTPVVSPSGVMKKVSPELSPMAFERMTQVIHERIGHSRQRSYVKVLVDKGPTQISKKLIEEVAELANLLPNKPNEEVVHKTTDLLFHLWIGLIARGIDAAAIYEELTRRFGPIKNEPENP
jgi:phosphoribosyl-ATP pyrophosphohydrolase